MKQRQNSLSRRQMALGTAAVGAATGLALALPTTGGTVAKATSKPQETADPAGYRESQHVLHYYRTARI